MKMIKKRNIFGKRQLENSLFEQWIKEGRFTIMTKETLIFDLFGHFGNLILTSIMIKEIPMFGLLDHFWKVLILVSFRKESVLKSTYFLRNSPC